MFKDDNAIAHASVRIEANLTLTESDFMRDIELVRF
jgi:hypothetical protein